MADDLHGTDDKLEQLRQQLIELLENFEHDLAVGDLRAKVLALVPAQKLLDKLGAGLIPRTVASSARNRILYYFQTYPFTVIKGSELKIVSGISDWPRRVRELRVQYGWKIYSGLTVKEMIESEPSAYRDTPYSRIRREDYAMLDHEQDRDAAHRWNVANGIRRMDLGVRDRILLFLRQNIGHPVSGEELRYVAKDATEWARRTRELRTEQGWPLLTKNTGRPDLSVGMYVLEEDRQSPVHDRHIPDDVRGEVLERDNFQCRRCGWNSTKWNKANPRSLELHHIYEHIRGGANTEDNLITLCTVCHDAWHATHSDEADFNSWLNREP